MNEDERERLEESIRRRAARPAREQLDDMIARGAIDAEGNVILRRPGQEMLATAQAVEDAQYGFSEVRDDIKEDR